MGTASKRLDPRDRPASVLGGPPTFPGSHGPGDGKRGEEADGRPSPLLEGGGGEGSGRGGVTNPASQPSGISGITDAAAID